MNYSILFAAAPLVLLGACSQEASSANEKATLASIRKVEASQIASFNNHDAEGSVRIYAKDSTFAATGMPYLEGISAIRPAFNNMVTDPAAEMEMTPKGGFVAASGDLAVTTADYAFTHTDPKTKKVVTDHGVNQTVWQKLPSGAWKNMSDFNIDVPPPEEPKAG